ncbi:MAG TPA: alpha/beta fold hydrolase [Nevskiaceae bacterium]|nr:alpha/beta fold hydrolase [Nevskiaceae bacterium]
MSRLAGLPDAGRSLQGTIDGAAGPIEVLVAAPKEPPRGFAVLCHPHPLYGGAMSNKVVYTLASIALKCGLVAARFNFRGVGASGGAHDESRGETDDCVTVVEWVRGHVPDAPLLLGGFSFGAFVSLKAAARVRPKALMSVAPPFGKYFGGEPAPPHPGCPWIAIHSRDDDVVSYDESARLLAAYDPPAELVTVDGAGHFFHNRLADLQHALVPFVARHFA